MEQAHRGQSNLQSPEIVGRTRVGTWDPLIRCQLGQLPLADLHPKPASLLSALGRTLVEFPRGVRLPPLMGHDRVTFIEPIANVRSSVDGRLTKNPA